MPRPLIAIVGSLDETRTYDPPVVDIPQAQVACDQLGAVLAQRGYDIVVCRTSFSGRSTSILMSHLSEGRCRPELPSSSLLTIGTATLAWWEGPGIRPWRSLYQNGFARDFPRLADHSAACLIFLVLPEAVVR